MNDSDKKDAHRHTGAPVAPRKPQRDDQPLKQMNEDADPSEQDETDRQDGLPPDSGKFEGRDPVLRDNKKPTDSNS
ncbi:MAG: hypothetical protein LPK02_01535 [Rhodobacterales bacterium]|nr:hypothetical protein [Rhodobacterales bacterium]